MSAAPGRRLLRACIVASSVFVGPRLFPADLRPVSPGEVTTGVGLSGGFSLAPDASRLIFPTNKGQAILDLSSGKLANANPAWFAVSELPACAWSPNGDALALTVYREGLAHLEVWNARDGSSRTLLTLPRSLYLRLPPVWSPDGRTLYFVVNQNLPWSRSDPRDDVKPTENNNVRIEASGRYDLTSVRERFDRLYPEAYAESNRSLIFALDVATGRAGVLGRGNDVETLYLSPNGRHLIASQPRQSVPGREARWTKQVLVDFYLFSPVAPSGLPTVDLEKLEDRTAGWSDAAGRRLEPLLKDLTLNTLATFLPPIFTGSDGHPMISWSPDGDRFAYATVGRQSTGDVFVFDLGPRTLRNLTAAVTLPRVGAKELGYAEHYSFNYNSHKFGGFYPPLWTSDGTQLLITGAGDAWAIAADGKSAPRLLSAHLPHEARAIIPAGSSGIAAVDTNGRISVLGKDRDSRTDTVWKVGLQDGSAEVWADLGVWTSLRFATDAAGYSLVVVGRTQNRAGNLYRISLTEKGEPVPLTRFRSGLANLQFPEARRLSWTLPSGQRGYGILHLPAGASAEHRLPMILSGYPGSPLSQLDYFMRAGPNYYTESLHATLRDGIAVFEADLPVSDEGTYAHVMQEVVASVNAATDAALATGVIDSARLGIEGTSFGGFMVQAVISQTDRFKAAVSVAGVGNWASNYLGRGGYGPRYHEEGQGRLVEPLWKDPARYLENSPIAYLDRVTTPLLLIHGEADFTVPIERSEEMMRGLEHLGRNAVFARYRRMGHDPDAEARQRIRAWFREHLLDREARAHLAELGPLLLDGPNETLPKPAPSASSSAP